VACAAPKTCGANECITDYRRDYPNGTYKAQIERIAADKGQECPNPERDAYQRAVACAASMTCGANECISDYRRAYPNGTYKAQIDRIAADKGQECPNPEKDAYERAVGCAAPRTCGALECLADYRRQFPDGAHKTDIDAIAQSSKAAVCPDPQEKEAYDRAVGCAAALRTCGAQQCIADYRRRFPNGTHKAEIDEIARTKGDICPDPVEEDVFSRAVTCAAAKPQNCGASECIAEYRSRYPDGRHKTEIEQIAQTKGATCPDPEKEAYQRAVDCASPLQCGADHCLVEYKRDYSNGRYRPLIDQISGAKGPDCRPTPSPSPTSVWSLVPLPTQSGTPLPPLNPRTTQDPGLNCARSDLEPIAQMICADADMAEANGELQRKFNGIVKSMRGDSQRITPQERAFRDRGINWIRERNQECNIPPGGSWNEMDLRKLKNCFLNKTRAHTGELQE
jgi:hypothetical protein